MVVKTAGYLEMMKVDKMAAQMDYCWVEWRGLMKVAVTEPPKVELKANRLVVRLADKRAG